MARRIFYKPSITAPDASALQAYRISTIALRAGSRRRLRLGTTSKHRS
jgi:hypothetical protein